MSQLQVTGEAKIRDIQGPVVANSGVVTALDGAASQYVRGDGTLADFPTSTGGGSSVSYYLNSSVSQGTIGGVAYRELSKDPIIGAGTDIPIAANGYVANYITDVNDPDVILVPGGNFNCEFYFSVNNNTGNPTTYAELYKYDGTTFTLLGTSAGVPESINQGTTIAPYYFAIPVATAALSVTDRLAIRIYVNVDSRTVTLHTENGHLCQVVTTLSKGMVSLNNLTDQSQYLATGTAGTDFNIVSTGDTHTFNIPSASASNRGLITTGSQTIAGIKSFNDAIKGEVGILLKNGVISSSAGYTALNGFDDTLIITSLISGTPYSNYLDFTPATSNTYTFPNLSGTLALLEGTQTFSGAKTFSLDILVNGLTIGRGAGSISTNTVVGSSALSANTTGYGNTSIGLNNLIANTTGFFNVAIGASSLISNTTGTYNAALGTSSLYNNTTGSNNTAVGQQAGETNTTGSNNTYIGKGSGYNITTGSNNTIIGAFNGTAALANNIVLADGAGNVRYRYDGTNNNLYGNVNFSSTIGNGTFTYTLPSATGTLALTSNLSAYLPLTGGTLTGALSGTSATFSSTIRSNATNGFAVGSIAGYRRIEYGSSAATSFALLTDADGFAGLYAGAATFSSSVGMGSAPMSSARLTITDGTSIAAYWKATNTNVATRDWTIITNNNNFGDFAIRQGNSQGADATSGTDRLFISSGGNVGIGTSIPTDFGSTYTTLCIDNATNGGVLDLRKNGVRGLTIAVDGNEPRIEARVSGQPLVFSTNNGGTVSERMRITSGGQVQIKQSGDTYSDGLRLINQAAGNRWTFVNGGDDNLYYGYNETAKGVFNNSTGVYTPLSDINKKKDFEASTIGLNAVLGLKPTLYRIKTDDENADKQLGFIAQEVKEFIPQAYSESINGDETFIGLNYNPIVAALVKAIQEQTQIITNLEARIKQLENK